MDLWVIRLYRATFSGGESGGTRRESARQGSQSATVNPPSTSAPPNPQEADPRHSLTLVKIPHGGRDPRPVACIFHSHVGVARGAILATPRNWEGTEPQRVDPAPHRYGGKGLGSEMQEVAQAEAHVIGELCVLQKAAAIEAAREAEVSQRRRQTCTREPSQEVTAQAVVDA